MHEQAYFGMIGSMFGVLESCWKYLLSQDCVNAVLNSFIHVNRIFSMRAAAQEFLKYDVCFLFYFVFHFVLCIILSQFVRCSCCI